MKYIKYKIKHFCLTALMLMMGSPLLEAQNPEVLTLDYCHERLVAVYPLVRQKLMQDQSAALRLENLNKNYLPQFDLNARASYQSDVTQVPISLPGMDIPSPDKDMYDLYLGLNQLIWDGGVNRDTKKIAEADRMIAQQQIEVELYKVKERVNGLFFKILLIQQSRALLLSNRQSVLDKLSEMESGIRHGVVLASSADALRAQVLQIDQQVDELDIDLAAHYQMLSELLEMQIPVSRPLALPEPNFDWSNYKNNRPEFELLSLNQQKLELSKNRVTSAYLPKISGFGKLGYGKPGLNMLSNEFDTYYYLGLGLNWDILNWNKQKNQIKLLGVQQEIVETEKEAFDKNVKIQVLDDRAQIIKYDKLIEKDEEIISLREGISRAASSQLDNGVITSSQYLDELNRETRAKMNLEMHRIQQSLARVNYLKTIGNL